MGIDNRDYYRGDSDTGLFATSEIPSHLVCFKLIVINIVVYFLQIFSARDATPDDLLQMMKRVGQHQTQRHEEEDPKSVQFKEETSKEKSPDVDDRMELLLHGMRISVVQEWLSLDSDKVLHGQVWRLLTCAFCHDREDVLHIVFNMLFLWWWGKTLEAMYGSREFLLFYLCGALVASFTYMTLDQLYGHGASMIGASGAVMATMMLYAIHYPRQTIMIFWVFPLEIRWLVFFYVIFDMHPILKQLAGDRLASGVAHAAHLGGFAFGWLYWKWNLRLEPMLTRLPRPRLWLKRKFGASRHLRVIRPDEDFNGDVTGSFDDRLDAVLAKLHEHGRASLTESEVKLLEEGSRRFRNRRGT